MKEYFNKNHVEDPDIAREMADTENPYREKASKRIFGIGKDKIIRKGERVAEEVGQRLVEEKKEESADVRMTIHWKESKEDGESEDSIKGYIDIKGHAVVFEGEAASIILMLLDESSEERLEELAEGISGTIDNNDLASDDLARIIKKYRHELREEFLRIKKGHGEYIINKRNKQKEITKDALKDILGE